LDGEITWREAREKAIVATRQYAKRQLTWLRGDARIEPWPALAPDLVERCVARLTEENLIAKNGRGLC
jgi:tRNA dimethylallyltransferase